MEARPLQKVFSLGYFRIPDYQRGYSWTEKELDEMWDDIEEINEVNGIFKKHYTGTIFLEKTKPSDSEKWLEDEFFFVVDGQQRLTTISILLFELLKVADSGYASKEKVILENDYLYTKNESGNSKVFRFSYQESDKNYKYLFKSIFEDESVFLENETVNLYAKNLAFAKKFFSDKLKDFTYEERNNLFRKLTTALIFDIRKIEEDLDVQAVFETMNNRGKPLTTLEKLKNRLIFLNDKLPQSEEDKNSLRKDINDAWGKIYNALAQNPEKYLDEDEFLSAHLSLYRKPKESVFSEKLAEKKVFEMFCNRSEKYNLDETDKKEPPVSHDKIKKYILKISDFAPIWYQVNNSKNLLINKILLLNSSKDVKIFISTLIYKIENKEKINFILDKLEKILFRNRVPGIWIMDERNVSTWARTIYTADKELETKINDVEKEMSEYLNQEAKSDNVINGFTSLFTYVRGSVGFHRWGALKYFLFEYDNELMQRFGEHHDKVSLSDYWKTTIEHVIPQEYSAYWLSEVSSVTDRVEDDEDKRFIQKVMINSLGNLTILRDGKNSSLGNKSWEVKQDRFKTGSYNEIDISRKPLWNEKEIHTRGVELLKFLEKKVPGLYFTSSEMDECLFYDFYYSSKILEKN